MAKIVIGENVKLDLDALLRSRLLIQANSGGGKSWCIRRIAEQAFGKLPVIIIDPEGEFATLREKYGYVLVGKGGETPADVRSAGLVAHRLLELKASAICDIFEMSPSLRHTWVKTFLQAMIDAPKNLWHPVLVIVDEAHSFCPEKGAGESESSEAMISLATRGRKRGFCAIFATQRISKLRKDAAAELHNNLIGKCFIDQDRKRAAEQLGIQSKEFRSFSEKMKLLSSGVFLAQGVAISTEIVEFKVGAVETTHPDINCKQTALIAPPIPEAIQHLLPKLADLPKAAEEKAKNEADLRTEIRSLKAQLSQRPKEILPAKEVKVIDQRAIATALKKRDQEWNAAVSEFKKRISGSVFNPPGESVVNVTQETSSVKAVAPPAVRVRTEPRIDSSDGDSQVTGPERRILNAIAWLNTIGVDEPDQAAVAFLAGYTYGGGGFNNPRGALNTKGLVEYRSGNRIRLTTTGLAMAQPPDAPLDASELQRMVMDRLPGPERKILSVLIDAYPNALVKEDCAEKAGYAIGGGFNNPCGRLRTLGLIDYPERGQAKAQPLLFLESA